MISQDEGSYLSNYHIGILNQKINDEIVDIAQDNILSAIMASFSPLFIENLTISHFSFFATAATTYLFKLAIAVTFATYPSFLLATFIGSLSMYFPTLFLTWGLWAFGVQAGLSFIAARLMQLGLSPMAGAYVLNLIMGWSIPLMPMLAIGVVGAAMMTLTVLMTSLLNDEDLQSQQENDGNTVFEFLNRCKNSFFSYFGTDKNLNDRRDNSSVLAEGHSILYYRNRSAP